MTRTNQVLPADGIIYLPVHEDAFLFKVASLWQFPAFVVCLGSSYFQRMMARLPQMAEAVMSCPGFEEYAQHHRANEVRRHLSTAMLK